MADAEGSLQPSKKRVAGREISRDDPGLDDDDEQVGEVGTFKRASEEVLATRRIVKVRREKARPASTPNPFAGLQLVTPGKSHEESPDHPDSAAKAGTEDPAAKAGSEDPACQENDDSDNPGIGSAANENVGKSDDVVTEHSGEVGGGRTEEVPVQENDGKEAVEVVEGQESGREKAEKSEQAEDVPKDGTGVEKTEDSKGDETNEEASNEADKKQEDQESNTAEGSDAFSSFQQLSSRQNAFTGLAGTGFSTSSFSFGLISKEGSASGAGPGSLFGLGSESLLHTSAGLGVANNGGLQLFRPASSEATSVGGGSKPVMSEVPVETGEENENAVFAADAVLFEYLDGGWKERGKGEVKVNVATSGNEKARLVMRARGNYRLILNANLYPDMCLKGMEKRGVTFACINSATEGRDGFTTFALKFKEASVVGDFRYAVDAHKGKKVEAAVTSSGDCV